jgi:hypothetical protein
MGISRPVDIMAPRVIRSKPTKEKWFYGNTM